MERIEAQSSVFRHYCRRARTLYLTVNVLQMLRHNSCLMSDRAYKVLVYKAGPVHNGTKMRLGTAIARRIAGLLAGQHFPKQNKGRSLCSAQLSSEDLDFDSVVYSGYESWSCGSRRFHGLVPDSNFE